MQTFKNIYTDSIRLLLAMVAVLVIAGSVVGQPSVRMHDITGCSNTEVLIPIEVVNMQNIAALTLFIKVDTNTVEYVGVEDVNEVFANGDFVGGENQDAQLITVNWFSLTPASIDSGLICNIRVVLKNSSCDLLFSNDCEFVKPDLTTVDNVEYVDGSIEALGSYVPDPLTQTVLEGSNVNISLKDVNESLSLNWQMFSDDSWIDLENDATYTGVETAELSIHSVPKELNEGLFRCYISNGECSEGTSESELFVTPNAVINNRGNVLNSLLEVYPNPVDDSFTCKINSDVNRGKLVLQESAGRIVKTVLLENVVAGEGKVLDLTNVKSGIYTLILFKQGRMTSVVKVIRR